MFYPRLSCQHLIVKQMKGKIETKQHNISILLEAYTTINKICEYPNINKVIPHRPALKAVHEIKVNFIKSHKTAD